MSTVNIKRAVDYIKAVTTVYTPIVEAVVNAIQAIAYTGRTDGKVTVRAIRSDQADLDDGLPSISGFEIEDNGIGFTDEHRQSFDTLYSDLKIAEGGKGFGRFMCLKYFEGVNVESIYKDGGGFRKRSFSMGQQSDIIVDEKVEAIVAADCRTTVTLDRLKRGAYEKKLPTVAKSLFEKLLPYFITEGYKAPDVFLCEYDGSGVIHLNDFTSDVSGDVQEVAAPGCSFHLKGADGQRSFSVRIFKFRSPRNHKSMISLVAHKREVSRVAIHKYIPEFIHEFYEKDAQGNSDSTRNYIVNAYVFGDYLDDNVSLERGDFEFRQDSDLLLGISQSAIEARTAEVVADAIGGEVKSRQEKKKERVRAYVDLEAPWHKAIVERVDISTLPYDADEEEIEGRLQREKFTEEMKIRREMKAVLSESQAADLAKNVPAIVAKISETSKNDLIHYVALRRNILELFKKSLEQTSDGRYSSEGVVHDIVFPRRGNTDVTPFESHNLWVVDERLNFTAFVASDIPLNGGKSDRPDLLVFNRRVGFRGENEPSNPITVFEFKKPFRDDFVNESSKEDPVEQIVRYINDIRDGKFKTPEGRKILVTDTTPCYGYVICELTQKVEQWLLRTKNFTPMPDRQGWFTWMGNINLYIEVLSWDKVLKDARMRNAVFFKKLGIE